MAQKITPPVRPVKTPTRTLSKEPNMAPVNLIFDRSNYRLLIISIAIVAFGFILMAGRTDIYSDTKIVIAPMVVLAGFAVGFVAILKKPSSKA